MNAFCPVIIAEQALLFKENSHAFLKSNTLGRIHFTISGCNRISKLDPIDMAFQFISVNLEAAAHYLMPNSQLNSELHGIVTDELHGIVTAWF